MPHKNSPTSFKTINTETLTNYHLKIRIISVLMAIFLIGFSEYKKHFFLLSILISLYCIYLFIISFLFNNTTRKKFYFISLYIDVLYLSILIGVRGGLRSDFFIGYFLILGYIVIQCDKKALLQISIWISICFTIVSIIFTTPDNFSIGRLLIRLALLLAIAYVLNDTLNILKQAENAHLLALIDPLTQVYTRQMLDIIPYTCKDSKTIYLSIIDIDDFKKVNDQFGHITGDTVLKKIGEIVNNNIASNDFCIRYGGEEFLIVFIDKDKESVITCINLIKQAFKSYNFKHNESYFSCSFSSGVTQHIKNNSLAASIEQADQALYTVKNNGKDDILFY